MTAALWQTTIPEPDGDCHFPEVYSGGNSRLVTVLPVLVSEESEVIPQSFMDALEDVANDQLFSLDDALGD